MAKQKLFTINIINKKLFALTYPCLIEQITRTKLKFTFTYNKIILYPYINKQKQYINAETIYEVLILKSSKMFPFSSVGTLKSHLTKMRLFTTL